MTVLYPVPEILPDPRARFIQIVHTCHALATRGVRVHLLAGIRRGCDGEGLLRDYGLSPVPFLRIVPLPVLRGRISWHAPFHAALLPRAMREPDGVIFVRYLKLAGFLLRWRRAHRLPVIFEAHEIFHKTTERPGKAATLKAMESFVYREADRLITISNVLSEDLRELFGRPADAVIPDGVPSDFLEIRREVPGNGILYVGQLYPWKGVDVLLRAMSRIPDERLVVVGGGGESLDRAKRIAGEEGVAERVDFRGTVPHVEVRSFLGATRVAVVPNRAEGVSKYTSPLKLFEAMAAGVPIVASDLPSLREVLRDGENALLVPPGEPEALAGAIRRLLQDTALASRIAACARRDARAFTWAGRADKIASLLHEAASGHRTGGGT
ncbi:MAG TPA: glycosyltransferase family 4 protein [Candidatus Bathyarchaeia archaeon]|nr:glycosyltransferase family 4 protein [Candidatus Bathyarchaeia archaeon]